MDRHNFFMLLRQDFAKLYPSLKPDEIYESELMWIIRELQIVKEKSIISLNEQLLEQKENERKNVK